jgi:SpoVK/Ycf46/Vps4 family AAA+-type ATPase
MQKDDPVERLTPVSPLPSSLFRRRQGSSLKGFTRKALDGGRRGKGVRARGVSLFGVPGTGRSALAKALGNETGRPTLILDVGSLMGSLVGQTEERTRQALKIVDAMAPCVLFIDEIEKALAGVQSAGDSGVSARMFGSFFTWLSDQESDVCVVATRNDVSKLPLSFLVPRDGMGCSSSTSQVTLKRT